MIGPTDDPDAATASIAGISAASSGVLPPSDSCGSSAQPSGMIRANFMGKEGWLEGRKENDWRGTPPEKTKDLLESHVNSIACSAPSNPQSLLLKSFPQSLTRSLTVPGWTEASWPMAFMASDMLPSVEAWVMMTSGTTFEASSSSVSCWITEEIEM